MAGNHNTGMAQQILQLLKNTKSIVPTQAWLANFLSAQRPGVPANSLASTAGFRLLAADMKTCLDAGQMAALPVGVVDVTVKESKLAGPVVLQVLDIEDMSRSRWSQIEEIEADERGETTKGREIIRVSAPGPEEESSVGTATPSGTAKSISVGPHKLLVEDIRGAKIFAIEGSKVEGINLNMSIGSKLLVKEAVIARGVLLLEAPNVTVLGGKVEALQTHWKANRKAQLKAAMNPAHAGDA